MAVALRWTLAWVLGCGVWGCVSQTLRAEVTISQVEVGYAETFKVGFWIPVRIHLRASEATECGLELGLVDSDGVEVSYPAEGALRLSPGDRVETRIVKAGRTRSRLTVRLRDPEGQLLAESAVNLGTLNVRPATDHLLVSLGGDYGVEEALALLPREQRRRTAHVAPAGAGWLPREWHGLEGINTLVAGSGSGALAELTPEQIAAVSRWIRMGGHLILSTGSSAADYYGPQGGCRAWIPGAFSAVEAGVSGSPLESFAGAKRQLADLTAAFFEVPEGTRLAVLTDALGRERPGIVESPLGLGRVTLVAVDLGSEPLARWPDRRALVARLLELSGTRDPEDESQASRLSHYGYQDLSGQLRSALDKFESAEGSGGVRMIAFSLIALLLAGYVLAIGPGDYYLLKKGLRRMTLTWLTFPVIVAACCGGLWWLRGVSKGHQPMLNLLEVVDVEPATGWVSGQTWAHLYSPETRRYDLQLRQQAGIWPESAAEPPAAGAGQGSGSLLAWQGLPGSGLGGFATNTPGLFRESYRIAAAEGDNTLRLEGVPIQTAATKSFTGRWWNTMTPQPTRIGQLSSRGGVLAGELVNPLKIPLEKCLLYYDRWVYRLDLEQFEPGQVLPIASFQRRDLEWRLRQTRTELGKGGGSYSITPWNPGSRDIDRILQIMMFHEAAGGDDYTRLTHRYHTHLELSRHLRQGRAVLVGRAASPATALAASDAPLETAAGQRWSYFRILYPVVTARSPSAAAEGAQE